ncbi:hypothetical protein [Bacillus sp. JJ1562]|uniref:hypothetical protein n=1 Tax=Bacillus sp. JJ1562 TaxID=3122960 RepID=UPI0030016BF2
MFTKINNFVKKITDLPDIPSPTYTASQLKEQFKTPSDELQEAHNRLVDELTAESASTNIGAKKTDGTWCTLWR